MARKYLVRSTLFPYHVTLRTNDRVWFQSSMDIVWNIFSSHCFEITMLFKAEIHAFVLMSNHLHLILSTPQEDLGKIMAHFSGSGTRTLNSVSGHSGHVFGGRYKWSLIDSSLYFGHALKYVYRNPVKAGICEKVEDYPYSSLHGLLGRAPLPFPIYYPSAGYWRRIPPTTEEMLGWLNKQHLPEHDLAIGVALRKNKFELPKIGFDRKASPLETELL
ncbi:MAG: transposase [Bdellovibrionota bacterium]